MTGRGDSGGDNPWRRGGGRDDPPRHTPRTTPRPSRADGPHADAAPRTDAGSRGSGAPRGPRPPRAAAWPAPDSEAAAAPRPERRDELRLHGLNAVEAMFARRPDALRKLYLVQSRIHRLQPLLKWCVSQRLGYRVVEEDDLTKLAGSAHHEGVVADVTRAPVPVLETWLAGRDTASPSCLLWLDGVGNPHNFGAILRSAAHFGIDAVLLPAQGGLALSGSAARVAEGGAEAVPLVRLPPAAEAIGSLHAAGYRLVATVARDGDDLFRNAPPARVVYVLGAEGEGMDPVLTAACDRRVSIPGTGAVESLNVATATGVLLASWRAAHG